VLILISCEKKDVDLQKNEPLLPTEKFVIKEFMDDGGLLRTDLTEQKNIFLSESIGLWLTYLLEKGDQARFKNQVDVMKSDFLKNNFIVWRLEKKKQASVNALIDDLRIIRVLFEAGEKWKIPHYIQLGNELGKNLVRYGMNDGLFVDFVDVQTNEKAKTLTISYIMPSAFNQMQKHELLSQKQVNQQLAILKNAPLAEGGFYPKNYDITSGSYVFDKELHMIDQLYTAYHMASVKEDTTFFKLWLLDLFNRDGKLYGRYNAQTNQPSVNYESPAVYAMAVRYLLVLDEKTLANQFLERMTSLKNVSTAGYIDTHTQATHIFDNLLPLLAEREVENANNYELE